MWSRDIIKRGACWKVGNRELINARKDRWIPKLKAGRIASNVSYDSNAQVKDLINDGAVWNVEKLKNIALPFKVQAIQSVHIGGPNQKDSRFWQPEKNGSYSAKTGYWIGMESDENNTSNSSCSTKYSLWSKIWSLSIPSKIKIFIWKVAWDIIATEANLITHHVPGSSRCALYGHF